MRTALRTEWENGLKAVFSQGVSGAGRFKDGAGRHGDFENI